MKISQYNKWSIRRLKVGAASVMIASGSIVALGQSHIVSADEMSQPKTTITAPTANTSTNVESSTDKALSKVTTMETSSEMPKMQNMAKVEKTSDKPMMVATSFKQTVDVPAHYVNAAKGNGPFLAGVNQTIPYEAFGGDGMLTRLILKASEGAKWSDNGVDKNSPLLPLKDLTKGKYFYQVSLNGNTASKKGQALLDQIKANGSHTYQATITIYGTKDGKVDMNTILGQKTVMIHINVAKKDMNSTSMMMKKDKMTMPMKKEMTSSKINTGMMMSNNKMSANMQMSSQAKSNDKAGKKMSMMSKNLPNTGETKQQNVGVLGMLSLAFATGLTALGLKKSKQR